MTTINQMREQKQPDLRCEIEHYWMEDTPAVHVLLGPFNFYIERVGDEGDSYVQMRFAMHMNGNGIRHGEQTTYLTKMMDWLRENPVEPKKQPVRSRRGRRNSEDDGSATDPPAVE